MMLVSFNVVLPFGRGVVRVDINLQDVDIDQCSTDGWFAGTHRCNLTTMEVSVPSMGVRLIYSVKLNCNPHQLCHIHTRL